MQRSIGEETRLLIEEPLEAATQGLSVETDRIIAELALARAHCRLAAKAFIAGRLLEAVKFGQLACDHEISATGSTDHSGLVLETLRRHHIAAQGGALTDEWCSDHDAGNCPVCRALNPEPKVQA